ncbi:MAG TPA: hypothetical protein VHM31_25035, partial [Polyangia bacterium]|nr:hypothetical protein [Polyangia bacterium]
MKRGTAMVPESPAVRVPWCVRAPRRVSRRASGFRFDDAGFGTAIGDGAGGGAGPSTTASAGGGGL